MPQGDHLATMAKGVFEGNGLPNIEFESHKHPPEYRPEIQPKKNSKLPYGISSLNSLLFFGINPNQVATSDQESSKNSQQYYGQGK